MLKGKQKNLDVLVVEEVDKQIQKYTRNVVEEGGGKTNSKIYKVK